MKEILKARGKFTRILSGGEPSWKYTVALFKIEHDSLIKIFLKNIMINFTDIYEIEIYQDLSSKYPDTFYVKNLVTIKPDNNIDLHKMITSKKIGIGSTTLQKIEEKLNDNLFNLIKNNSQKIIDNLNTDKQKEAFQKFINEFNNDSLNFFIENDLVLLYRKMNKIFGLNENFIEKYKTENPYKLFIDYNIDFTLVDKFAIALKEENKNSAERYEATIIFAFRQMWMNNNTLVEINEIFKIYKKIMGLDKELFFETIERMINKGILKFIEDKKLFTLQDMYMKEHFIVQRLKELNSKRDDFMYSNLQEEGLSFLQNEAYLNCLKNNVSIISGYPGTGKTYLIQLINKSLLEKYAYENEIELLTPTGRAATIISTKTNINARTIHSFLKLSDDEETIVSYNNFSSDTKVLIIDEFSMVNIELFYLLLLNCVKLEKIIFIGDYNQLPCIGPGNILQDIYDSNLFAKVSLKEVFRTEKMDLVSHYLDINKREIPLLKSESVETIKIISEEYLTKIKDIFISQVNQYSMDDVVILIPTYKGKKGIYLTNNIIQKYLFGEDDKPIYEISYKDISIKYYLGDKVIQLKNVYDKNVFNGEIGYIRKYKNDIFTIEFPNNKFVDYTKEEFREYINLAYAITIHKFQGSEAKVVIFVVFPDFGFMLSKKLIYTAVSRAKEKLFIVGDRNLYVSKIVDDENQKKILTNMQFLLEDKYF
ncbi:ATP-dependent RecD-like DNA helicase [Mycoplasmopsis lipophila]|uniref:ATP-dependent DNA helicase n=1 Tax=Mycoplasmopsis lipophila TaxID=2117 RepID=UPI0038730F4F